MQGSVENADQGLAATLRELRSTHLKARANGAESHMSQWQRSGANSRDCRNSECGEAGDCGRFASGRGEGCAGCLVPTRTWDFRSPRAENEEPPLREDAPGVSGLNTLKVVGWHVWEPNRCSSH